MGGPPLSHGDSLKWHRLHLQLSHLLLVFFFLCFLRCSHTINKPDVGVGAGRGEGSLIYVIDWNNVHLCICS